MARDGAVFYNIAPRERKLRRAIGDGVLYGERTGTRVRFRDGLADGTPAVWRDDCDACGTRVLLWERRVRGCLASGGDDDSPASIEELRYAPAAGGRHVMAQTWNRGCDGARHRDGDRPARIVVSISSSGAKSVEREWWCAGRLHREGDQPAVEVCVDGCLAQRLYCRAGAFHRDDARRPVSVDLRGIVLGYTHHESIAWRLPSGDVGGAPWGGE